MDLLMRLKNKTRIFYKSANDNYIKVKFCTFRILYICRNGGAFRRMVKINVTSLSSLIDFKISGFLGASLQNISNCLYDFEQLIQNQGLSYVFGRRGQGSDITTDWVYEKNKCL